MREQNFLKKNKFESGDNSIKYRFRNELIEFLNTKMK